MLSVYISLDPAQSINELDSGILPTRENIGGHRQDAGEDLRSQLNAEVHQTNRVINSDQNIHLLVGFDTLSTGKISAICDGDINLSH